MCIAQLRARIEGRYQRTLARWCFRRPLVMRNTAPLVSFTFDDFPRSALYAGGAILKRLGFAGTFYASFGLMGREAPTGEMFEAGDLAELVAQGHELGCHTFHHCHAWETAPAQFEESIAENRRALERLLPGWRFQSFSYPISCPRPATKRRTGRHFATSRGGGQSYNHGVADLNHLSAYFLEKDGGDPAPAKRIIDAVVRDRGWLVLATHDVSEAPTPYGCRPGHFEEVVRHAASSGARILPVHAALAMARSGKAGVGEPRS
jgi:peptidoglycan/xylan/chitin deacetylase (PgdA/CDA1 family)